MLIFKDPQCEIMLMEANRPIYMVCASGTICKKKRNIGVFDWECVEEY